MFRKQDDFEAFQRVMVEAHQRQQIRILSYCILSSHWHFVVWPEQDGQLTDFFRWLSHTHAMRWRVSHRTVGYGPLYQRGRRYGADDWVAQTVNELGSQHTVRPEGRPSKASQLADQMTNSQRAGSGNAKRKST